MKSELFNVARRALRGLYHATFLGAETGPPVTRYFMYGRLERYRQSWSPSAKALSISNSRKLALLMGFQDRQIENAAFPKVNLLDLPYASSSLDAVFSDQVLEHIEGNPQRAIDEGFRVLKPGGVCLHTTCFVNPIHGHPGDYWRFTPSALELLCKGKGKVIEVGGWGNPYVWLYSALGLRGQPIPSATWHPAHWVATKNIKEWPIVTWVLAQKV